MDSFEIKFQFFLKLSRALGSAYSNLMVFGLEWHQIDDGHPKSLGVDIIIFRAGINHRNIIPALLIYLNALIVSNWSTWLGRLALIK
jgi:hypothetical protein